MEVTKFVVSGRDNAKLFGDYAKYRTLLSNRIHNLRTKLGIATKPRAKYSSKAPVTAEDIGRNKEFVNLLLLTAERAWAHAMSMREIHSADKKGITGSTRSHIISRLHKATKYASTLYQLLTDNETTGAVDEDVLEARAYAAMLSGTREFERQKWEPCVESYSEARIIYSALATSTKSDMFKDLLSDPVDPSIRYGAYQMKLPRTVAIPNIARKFFPRHDSRLVSQVEKLDADVLNDQPTRARAATAAAGTIPKSITWRSRTVDLEDAAIATALASVNSAAEKLTQTLASVTAAQAKGKASAYDEILIASQDAVDATKHAIDELAGEGVGQGDKRMQSLQITRTAVSYEMVSWRIGRNRVLVGEQDGAVIDKPMVQHSKKKKAKVALVEGTGRKLARSREKAALYDSILQSLDSIKELPGVAADASFLEELDAKYGYFSALKCLTLARSHALLSNPKNALALLARASEKCDAAHSQISSQMDTSDSSPPNIAIFPSEVHFLKTLLDGELQHYRALVELSNLAASQNSDDSASRQPLVERLSQYPAKDVDLKNLVTYPPKLEPIPVKPLFFDAAWNYIEYPGREVHEIPETNGAQEVAAKGQTVEQTAQQKKGWFGFGR
ncbi:signal recognition particle protein [Drepanopeziza brunnea f. sp. 'multigermtubi' MB_m1]|uniref:Signal recognition particle subunit SRP68 n=1 Tax=Marssonina brunnea f. sp. multigermtubi (strain MB_m1) TaxID=1072389 RepID=K1XG53_MARBU|nr:signal recognition particle protein [Drepanopeziza brunnea f. sp. 'multigermtubi' MB_m1]EKD19793.1 signal recognition particle protein [Drepanopeziza brunnea f. sp. 'multigermtubi' MB_m1]